MLPLIFFLSEIWPPIPTDEGDEDYDGQLQDYNNERFNTDEIKKHLQVQQAMGNYQDK